MKKNLILLSILTALLTFTYWFEEIGGTKRLTKEKQEKALFQNKNLGSLTEINFPKFGLILKNGKYFTKGQNYPGDKRKIDKIISVFSAMEVVSVIEKEKIRTPRKHFFPQEDLMFSFKFERGELIYRLGAKLEYSQDFYIEVIYGDQKNLLVVRDGSPQYGVYQEKSLERSSQKYDRLKFILALREKDLFDTHPFKNFQLKLDKVLVENFRNKKFLINFSKRETEPHTFSGLSYKTGLFEEMATKLNGLYAINIHFGVKDSDLSLLQSTIYLPQKVQLFKKLKDREGYFLKVESDNDIYELSQKDSTLFFSNVQDFWNKEILKEKDYHVATTFIFRGRPNIPVKIKESRPFEVQSYDAPFNLNQDAFKKIFSLLLNSAERVSEVDPDLKGKKSIFDIKVNDLLFKILKVGNELLFVNEKENLVYIYDVGPGKPIDFAFEDYFYQKK